MKQKTKSQEILLKFGKAGKFSDFVAAIENQKFITKGDLLSEKFFTLAQISKKKVLNHRPEHYVFT